MSSQDRLKIDAHQHFWRYRAADYPWIDDSMAELRQDFTPAHLRPLLDQAGLDGCIAVQARASASETDELLALARQHPWIYGVIGWVDLRAEDLEQRLQRWADAPQLRGFRHQIQDESSPAACMQGPDFARGIHLVQQHELVYEVLVKSADLGAAAAFCRRHDQHHLVLDHLGKPDIGANDPQAWAAQLAPLAALPHVSCKLSGLITEADWSHWQTGQLLPYLHLALELFGTERLMFGSDWPVCLLAGEYADTCQVTERALEQLSAAERGAIWGGNACRIYGLQGPLS